jgi:hypothetical protein
MNAKIQFSIETRDGDRVGKLDMPHHKVADWLNFLIAPRQQAKIISAKQRRTGLTLYFQSNENLYSYIHQHLEVGETTAETPLNSAA